MFEHFKLKIESKPVSFHGHTVRKNISQTLWKKVRQEALKENKYKCSICGFSPEEDSMKDLHVHEIESYDFQNGICELKGLNLICVKCHSFHHMRRTTMTATKEYMDELIQHFMEVNECDRLDYESYKMAIRLEMRKNSKLNVKFEKVRFKISGDIPYKQDIINVLKNKGLYAESEKPISEHFARYFIESKEFNFNDFKTREAFDDYKEELDRFLKNKESERYRDLFIEKASFESRLK